MESAIQAKHSSSRPLLKRYGALLLKLALAVAVFFFLSRTAQIKFDLFAGLFHQPFLLSCTITMFLLMIILSAHRWHLLNSAQEIHLGFFRTIVPTYLGIAFNNLLPGAIGGDVVRTYYLFKKAPNKKSTALITIFLDRMLGFLGLVVLIGFIAVSRLSQLHEQPQLFYLLFLFALFCLSVLFAFAALMVLPHRIGVIHWLSQRFPQQRWSRSLVSLLEALRRYRMPKLMLFKCLMSSVAIQLLITFSIMTLAKMMHFPPIAFVDYVIALGITQIVNMIPATPGGIGIGEMAFANILLLLNPGTNAAYATIFLAYRLISILVYLPGVLCYIPRFMLLKQKNIQQSAT